MVFAIDATSANKEKRTGVENYALHLIEAMKREPLTEGERIVLFSPTPLHGVLANLPSGWESQVLKWKLKKGWMQGRVSWELFRRRPSVFFVPAQGIPCFAFGVPILTTIHDAAFRRIGNLYESRVRRRIESATRLAVRKAKIILTPSQFTEDELQSIYHIDEKRIAVTSLAVDTTVYRRLGTPKKNFFLYVGRLEKKKNVTTIIHAFELFKQNRGIGDPFELVLVGEPGFGYSEIKTYIERSPQRDSIQETGYLSDSEVAQLMNEATALLLPSWYEGFGIPNLEAMACGTALITSDIPVHHEVAGDAAIFALPQDPEVWTKAMIQIVSDSNLRESLIEKGDRRVAEFSWGQTARQTWSVLRSLI